MPDVDGFIKKTNIERSWKQNIFSSNETKFMDYTLKAISSFLVDVTFKFVNNRVLHCTKNQNDFKELKTFFSIDQIV